MDRQRKGKEEKYIYLKNGKRETKKTMTCKRQRKIEKHEGGSGQVARERRLFVYHELEKGFSNLSIIDFLHGQRLQVRLETNGLLIGICCRITVYPGIFHRVLQGYG